MLLMSKSGPEELIKTWPGDLLTVTIRTQRWKGRGRLDSLEYRGSLGGFKYPLIIIHWLGAKPRTKDGYVGYRMTLCFDTRAFTCRSDGGDVLTDGTRL